jgi:hypothetical protein
MAGQRAEVLSRHSTLPRLSDVRIPSHVQTLSARDIPEVRTVRPKKRSAVIKPSLLLEIASHTTMGVAVGLAFAFLATHITPLGVATLISYSHAPKAVMLMFVGTCAAGFGIGATLTGLVITLTEDSSTTQEK